MSLSLLFLKELYVAVCKAHDGLYPMLDLAITEMLQQLAEDQFYGFLTGHLCRQESMSEWLFRGENEYRVDYENIGNYKVKGQLKCRR